MITSAADPVLQPWRKNRLLQGATAVFVFIWLAGAIAPINRLDWLLENLLVFAAIGILIGYYRTHRLSDIAYVLITVFLLLHTIGAHYTYSEAPPGRWLQDAFSLERNPYDRIIHFTFGVLLIYPTREALVRFAGAGRRLSGFSAFTIIATCSVIYEILEWIVAIIVSPEAAMAYLGTQGDVFDAQKDSALAIIGAVIGLQLYWRHFKRPNAG